MDLDNINLLELQTSYMKNDPTTIAFCKSLEPLFKKLSKETKLTLIYAVIDMLPEKIIDELAWQWHVDFYDINLNISKKRNLVKNTRYLHEIKGTPEAVILAATSVFGRTNLEEWFEYNGKPYYFRLNVDVTDEGVTEESINRLERLVNEYKNKRSWIEEIKIFLTNKLKIYIGSINLMGETTIIYPKVTTKLQSSCEMNVPIVNYIQSEITTIYPI